MLTWHLGWAPIEGRWESKHRVPTLVKEMGAAVLATDFARNIVGYCTILQTFRVSQMDESDANDVAH